MKFLFSLSAIKKNPSASGLCRRKERFSALKITAFFLAVCLPFSSPVFAATTTGVAAQKIILYADSQIRYFESRKKEIASDASVSDNFCFEKGGFRTELTVTARLGLEELWRSTALALGNKCLRNDVLEIENRIARLAKIGTRSKIGCSENDRVKLQRRVEFLFFTKRYLEDFALVSADSEKSSSASGQSFSQAFFREFNEEPPAELKAISAFSEKKYQDVESCSGTRDFFTFKKVKEKMKAIFSKLKTIAQFFSDMKSSSDTFFSGKEKTGTSGAWAEMVADAKKSAEYSANEWFTTNLEQPLSGIISIGRKNRDSRSESDAMMRKKDEIQKRQNESQMPAPITVAETVAKVSEISAVNGALEYDEKSRKNTKDFLEFQEQVSINSGDLTGEISSALEARAMKIPSLIKKGNTHLDKSINFLEEICRRHSPCELPSS